VCAISSKPMRQCSLYPFSRDHVHAFYGIYVVDHCVQGLRTLHPKKFIGVGRARKQCRRDFFDVLNKNFTIAKKKIFECPSVLPRPSRCVVDVPVPLISVRRQTFSVPPCTRPAPPETGDI